MTTFIDEHIAADVLAEWADGIRAHEPHRVASLFTEDAVFQGFDPTHGVGRGAVAAYYAKQPVGLTAAFEILERRQPSSDVHVAYSRVDFALPTGVVIPVHLTVILRTTSDGWLISLYHVSKIDKPASSALPSSLVVTERKTNV